jgi:hypothetical protein
MLVLRVVVVPLELWFRLLVAVADLVLVPSLVPCSMAQMVALLTLAISPFQAREPVSVRAVQPLFEMGKAGRVFWQQRFRQELLFQVRQRWPAIYMAAALVGALMCKTLRQELGPLGVTES